MKNIEKKVNLITEKIEKLEVEKNKKLSMFLLSTEKSSRFFKPVILEKIVSIGYFL